MNITFLIGNGFDINLGLKTKYTDFYNEYIASVQDLDDSDCRKRFAMKIDGNYDTWADFEMGFANNISGSADDVRKILYDFNSKFTEYLKKQVDLCCFNNPDILKLFSGFLLNWRKHLEVKDKSIIDHIYNSKTHESIQLDFVSFNYTDIVQKIKKQYVAANSSKELRKIDQNKGFSEYIGNILNIHGVLGENIIIGVDSLEQLADEKLRQDTSLANLCVKSKLNEYIGNNSVETQFVTMVQGSQIICAYGLSFGKTDLSRWKVIKEWVKQSDANKFVAFKYGVNFDNYNRSYLPLLLNVIDSEKNGILALLGFEVDEYEKYRPQIFVIDSSKVLNFKLIQEPPAEGLNADETDLIKA